MKNLTEVELLGRSLQVEYSQSAVSQMKLLTRPVYLEMELHFSCLVKKQMVIRPTENTNGSVSLNDALQLSFRAIVPSVCAPSSVDIHQDESIKIFDVAKPERFVPEWVLIDFKDNQWTGDFGYTDDSRG